MARIYRVVRAHEPDHVDPLILKKGESVPFERRRTQWDGWLWCTKSTGESGWVPESWVTVHGDHCVAKRDYIATELVVHSNQVLDAILTESGWLLAISSNGTVGWVPLECVEQAATDQP